MSEERDSALLEELTNILEENRRLKAQVARLGPVADAAVVLHFAYFDEEDSEEFFPALTALRDRLFEAGYKL